MVKTKQVSIEKEREFEKEIKEKLSGIDELLEKALKGMPEQIDCQPTQGAVE